MFRRHWTKVLGAEFAAEADQGIESNTTMEKNDSWILWGERTPIFAYINDGVRITKKRGFLVSLFGLIGIGFYKDRAEMSKINHKWEGGSCYSRRNKTDNLTSQVINKVLASIISSCWQFVLLSNKQIFILVINEGVKYCLTLKVNFKKSYNWWVENS